MIKRVLMQPKTFEAQEANDYWIVDIFGRKIIFTPREFDFYFETVEVLKDKNEPERKTN